MTSQLGVGSTLRFAGRTFRGGVLLAAIALGGLLAAPGEAKALYEADALLVSQDSFSQSWVAWQNDDFGQEGSLHYWMTTYSYYGYLYATYGYYYDESLFANAYFMHSAATQLGDTLIFFRHDADATYEARVEADRAATYCMWAYFL